jgi:hypothetical protein
MLRGFARISNLQAKNKLINEKRKNWEKLKKRVVGEVKALLS